MLKLEGVRKWTKSQISKSTHNIARKPWVIVQIDWIITILYFGVRGCHYLHKGIKAINVKIEFNAITQKLLNGS